MNKKEIKGMQFFKKVHYYISYPFKVVIFEALCFLEETIEKREELWFRRKKLFICIWIFFLFMYPYSMYIMYKYVIPSYAHKSYYPKIWLYYGPTFFAWWLVLFLAYNLYFLISSFFVDVNIYFREFRVLWFNVIVLTYNSLFEANFYPMEDLIDVMFRKNIWIAFIYYLSAALPWTGSDEYIEEQEDDDVIETKFYERNKETGTLLDPEEVEADLKTQKRQNLWKQIYLSMDEEKFDETPEQIYNRYYGINTKEQEELNKKRSYDKNMMKMRDKRETKVRRKLFWQWVWLNIKRWLYAIYWEVYMYIYLFKYWRKPYPVGLYSHYVYACSPGKLKRVKEEIFEIRQKKKLTLRQRFNDWLYWYKFGKEHRSQMPKRPGCGRKYAQLLMSKSFTKEELRIILAEYRIERKKRWWYDWIE